MRKRVTGGGGNGRGAKEPGELANVTVASLET